MTTYNFESFPDRKTTYSKKWQEAVTDPDLLPMWVADMDFEALPEITDALQNYVDTMIYGYAYTPDGLLHAICDWQREEHGFEVAPTDIVLFDTVVAGMSLAIQAYTKPGDAILINSPVYPMFEHTIRVNGRRTVANSLLVEGGQFEVDFDTLEKELVDNDVKLYFLCSPQNPGGRVWDGETLRRIADLCVKHDVILVSDEVHQDMALFGNTHHVVTTLGDYASHVVVLSAPMKTFNIAGLKLAYAVIADENLRAKFLACQSANNQNNVATPAMLATEAAYRHGHDWVVQLKQVIEGNVDFVEAFFAERAPKIQVMRPQGTYMMWLDFSAYGLSDEALQDALRHKAKVQMNAGPSFGIEGAGHMRFNVASPLTMVQEACERIVTALEGVSK
jgi:cystathionine beta-lyase